MRIDVYFTDYFLVAEIDEQNHEGRELIFDKKKTKHRRHQKKKFGCKFLRASTSNVKKVYDTDYEVSKMQIFISKFIETK